MSKRGRKRKIASCLDGLDDERQQLLVSEQLFGQTSYDYSDEANPFGHTSAVSGQKSASASIKDVIIAQALNLIPQTFKSHRMKYIRNMLNHFDTSTDVTISEVKILVDQVQRSYGTLMKYFGIPNVDFLWDVTFATNTSHMLFLGPPTEVCFKCSKMLQTHNQPTEILCFNLSGPLPALKITLRCTQCAINYRYDLYTTLSIHTN